MTVSPLTGKFITAAGYSSGRRGHNVDFVVLHTAEGSTTVEGLGNYFAGTTAGSSHAGIGQGGQYAQYVPYADTAWTNPSINTRSDTLEFCAFKAWSRAKWLAHPQLIETGSHWVAWRCSVRGIPIRFITGAQAASGVRGVLDHQRINDGFHASDHSDVGRNFPWDIIIGRAQQIAGLQPKPQGSRVIGLTNPPMHGQDVLNVQHAMNFIGNHLTLDGVYKTADANVTQLFKDHRNINEAGIGPKTIKAIRAIPGLHG